MKDYSLILLDRDGVMGRKPLKHTYVTYPEKFEFLPQAREAISILTKKGFKIAVISNQKGISKGLMTLEDLNRIDQKILGEIAASGGKIEKLYYCLHGEKECQCRKPKPGMILQAIKHFKVPKEKVVYLGDFFSDFETARNAGVDFMYIDSPSDERDEQLKKFKDNGIKPKTFKTLYEAALFLTK